MFRNVFKCSHHVHDIDPKHMFTMTKTHSNLTRSVYANQSKFYLICNVDVASYNSVDGLLEVDVLVVVVVVVAVDPVVDVGHSIKDGECHSSKHQGNKLRRIKGMNL